MRPDELETQMRAFETGRDQLLLPEVHIVVRVDGRGFTRLTKELLPLERPFDEKFRDAMIAALTRLMDCGFRTVFGYTQSDEISILLHRNDDGFARKERKLISVLAGEASAALSLALGAHAAFDARLSLLPSAERVVDYFRWRAQDAARNALNGHCYWMMRREGTSAVDAQRELAGRSTSDKHEMLYARGVNFDRLPSWQKRVVGAWWERFEKEGRNPITGETVMAERTRLHVETELPLGDDYSTLLRERLCPGDSSSGSGTA
jgi:tRNA(His) 5'-end guanylyltransferase